MESGEILSGERLDTSEFPKGSKASKDSGGGPPPIGSPPPTIPEGRPFIHKDDTAASSSLSINVEGLDTDEDSPGATPAGSVGSVVKCVPAGSVGSVDTDEDSSEGNVGSVDTDEDSFAGSVGSVVKCLHKFLARRRGENPAHIVT